MPDWIYAQGHIGWALFFVLVYSGLFAMVLDYIWRRTVMPGRRLLGSALTSWVVGLVVLLVLA